MKPECVDVKGFRSIANARLMKCGGLNVLIGKNNSGKSNILAAIRAFFTSIQGGNFLTLDPPIGQEIDFHKKNTELPLEIKLTFVLAAPDRETLSQEIIAEAPQMTYAVEGLDPTLRLSATVRIAPRPRRFGFISRLALCDPKAMGEGDRVILSIPMASALEIQEKVAKSQGARRDADRLEDILRYFSAEEWERSVRGPEESRLPLRFYFTHAGPRREAREISTPLLRELELAAKQAATYSDFENTVRSMKGRASEAAATTEAEPLAQKLTTFAGVESSVPQYVRTLLGRLADMKVLYMTEHRKPIGREEAQRLLSLKVRRGGTAELRNIQETVAALLGVHIDAFESGSGARGGEATAELDVDNFLVEVNGSGIREALRLILDVEFHHPEILLVEEPEIHLHPALETSMMQYLRRMSSRCQIFISTHSTNFLDTADMKNVYLISKRDSTEIEPIGLEEAESRIPRELGIRLSSLFMFDRLVFVEGSSDESILREWAGTMGVNLSQANTGFIAMGGIRNFGHYAAGAILGFLTKRRVKTFFLLDRDEREDAEVARLKNVLEGKGVLRVLMKRELENYLLCPRAVAEFIRLRAVDTGAKAGEDVGEAEIARRMEECAERLKVIAIGKRVARISCKPLYASLGWELGELAEGGVIGKLDEELGRMMGEAEEAKKRLQEVYEEQKETVDRAWAAGKFSIVPGDLLLDMLLSQYGIRFKKERGDGARLAALMRRDEIDEEIVLIVGEIGT